MILPQLVAMLCCKLYCSSACNLCLLAGSVQHISVLYNSQGSHGVEGKVKMVDVACLLAQVNADYVQETLVKVVGGLPCRVIEARQTTSIKTTSQLVSLIGGSRKSKQGAGKQIHPATRVFQVASCCNVAISAQLA